MALLHRLDRQSIADEDGVVARLGQRKQPQIAIENDRLGFARDAGKAEPARALALGHHALADELAILAIMHDERVEIARVGQRAAHHLRAGDRAPAIGKGDRAGLAEQADFRDLAALQALGQRGAGKDANLGGVAGAAQNEVDDRRLVDRRTGVGPRENGRHAARRRGRAGGGDRLAMFGAGFADECAHVDEAGRDDVARAIDDPRLRRRRFVA